MTDTPTEAEQQAAFAQSLAFNTEAARSGLFAAAIDIAETMKNAGVPHVDAIILTAAAEFTAQLWQQTGHRGMIPMAKCRQNLLSVIKTFFGKHVRLTREGAKAPTIQ